MEKPVIKKSGRNTSISFFTLDTKAEESVRQEIETIFKNRRKDDMKDIIYTCVKELMVNASKSNIKKTFFVEAKINEQDREIYEIAKTKVKKLMTDHYFCYLREKLRKHGNNVEVDIEDLEKGIVISVKNPTPMYDDEERKVRENLSKAMQSDELDLTLFYSDDGKDSEGASLGLILVVNLLRQMNINPALFRVGVVEGNTVARIEIPLAEGYEGYRAS